MPGTIGGGSVIHHRISPTGKGTWACDTRAPREPCFIPQMIILNTKHDPNESVSPFLLLIQRTDSIESGAVS